MASRRAISTNGGNGRPASPPNTRERIGRLSEASEKTTPVSRILLAAMDVVLQAWPAEGDFYRSHKEVESVLLQLEEALLGPGSPATDSGTDRLLARRLLEALRIEVLRRSASE